MSRILWVDGLDERNTNTRDRFISIHCTKHKDKIRTADNHGCVRTRNTDVAELFTLADESTHVIMEE
jgi:L,D-transpeptidase YbiS